MWVSRRRLVLVVALLLSAMAVSGVLAFASPCAALVLLLLSGVWIGLDQGFEGPVLLTLVPRRHGITAADLVGVLGAGVAVCSLALYFR